MTRDSKSTPIKTFTPLAAAKHAGCGRTTIMKAIKEHDLHATRDNRNRWKIDAEDLEKWMENRPVTDATVTDSDGVTDATVTATDATMQLMKDLGAAEATIIELRSQLEKTDARNADEIRRLERIIERLSAPKPSLIQRIFGAPERS
jgi:excisionase family DNA binding protein